MSKSQTLCDPAAALQDAKTLDAECGVRSRPTTEQAALVLTARQRGLFQIELPITRQMAGGPPVPRGRRFPPRSFHRSTSDMALAVPHMKSNCGSAPMRRSRMSERLPTSTASAISSTWSGDSANLFASCSDVHLIPPSHALGSCPQGAVSRL